MECSSMTTDPGNNPVGPEQDLERRRKITTAKDWFPDANEDLGNPQNWPRRKKIYHTMIPISVAFLCPFGSSVYTPGISKVMAEFHVTRDIALLPFTLYLLGLAFGPVIAAPISETFGRRIVYISALPISGIFTIGAGFSRSSTSLTICRFLAGLTSSPGLSLGPGVIADIFQPHKRVLPMAVFVTAVQMGPALGPLIGGFVTEKVSWRWTQWVILFGVAIVVVFTLGMSETYKHTILKARATRHGIEGPPEPGRTRTQAFKYFATKTIIRPVEMLLTEPIVTLFDVYAAFAFGLLNAFYGAFSWVFETQYGFSIGDTGLTYLGQAVGSLMSLGIICYVSHAIWDEETRRLKQPDAASKLPPERKLILAKIGALMLPASLFWFGWTAQPSVHWISPVAAESIFGCAILLIFTCALMFLQDCYGAQYGASAASSNTFARYLSGFAFPMFAVQMYEGLGTGWATSLLAFVSCLLIPIPFAFDQYGERIRAKSKFRPDE